MEFTPSKPLSIGMELELQLLDGKTLDLADGILPLMKLYPDNPYLKPEFIQNTIEVASKVCRDLDELESHVSSLIADLMDKCRGLEMRLCGAGSHPFSQRLALITPLPRYLRIEKVAGYLGHIQITFATHVHVGMTSGDEAIAVMRELKAYLPLLIALSASSPFWRGYETGYVSYRHRILSATRSYGIPPSFAGWEEFCKFFSATSQAGVFETIHDIHWDIRPRPHLGTLEVRVMDAQSTVSEAATLAGLVRVLAAYLSRMPGHPEGLPRPLSWWLEKENHFQASRLGLAANYIIDEEGGVRPMKAVAGDVFDVLSAVAGELGQSASLDRLRRTVDGPTAYDRQISIFKNTGSLTAVTAALVDELERETFK